MSALPPCYTPAMSDEQQQGDGYMDLHAGIEFMLIEIISALVQRAGLSRADVQELAGAEISRRVAENEPLLDATRAGEVRRAAELAVPLALEVALSLYLPTNDD